MAGKITDFDSIVSTGLPFIGLQIGKAPGTEFYIRSFFPPVSIGQKRRIGSMKVRRN
jgi:hypothetical protein